jgi:hypothetical protein
MSDEARGDHVEQGGDSTDSGYVLLVIIVANPTSFDDLVTGLLDIGVSATIAQSKGLMAFLREEMPVFSGLAAMIPEVTGSRVVFSATTRELASNVMQFIDEEFEEAERPIGLSIPVDRVAGLRR